jgi:hypothetical protein
MLILQIVLLLSIFGIFGRLLGLFGDFLDFLKLKYFFLCLSNHIWNFSIFFGIFKNDKKNSHSCMCAYITYQKKLALRTKFDAKNHFQKENFDAKNCSQKGNFDAKNCS